MKVAIIGAGLAGLSAGYLLGQQGCDVSIYESSNEIASGASGNPIGMVNPRLSALKTPEAEFYIHSFRTAITQFEALSQTHDIGWNPCGALHLITDDKRDKRYRQTVENWGWGAEHMSLLSTAQASEIAGVDIPFEALYLSQSGSVSPKKLCTAMAKDLDIQFNTKIESLDAFKTDAIIIACGMGSKAFADLPLKPVRGQISEIKTPPHMMGLQTNIHYGGYISAPVGDVQAIGATFQRWLNHTDILDEDNDYNINSLSEFLPHLAEGLDEYISGARASIRTTTPDHAPVIGHIKDNVYVLTALGSHGVTTSIGGAQILCDMISDNPVNHSEETLKTLSPARF